MQFTGKIIGLIIGLLILGPIGGIVGLFIGNHFDKKASRFANINPEAQRQAQRIFSDITFSVMGHIAKADGRVCEAEIRVARAIMDKIGFNEDQRKRAMEQFAIGKESSFNLNDALDTLANGVKHQRSLLRMFLDIQIQATYANKVASPAQQRILQSICKRLGIAPLNFNFLNMMYGQNSSHQYQYQQQSQGHQQQYYRPQQGQQNLNEAYATLGVSKGTSKTEIKRAYRKLMSQNHPDKLVAKGLPEEMIKLATEKTQRIQKAYDLICKSTQ